MVFSEKIKTQTEERSTLVHGCGRYVDVDEHLADGRADRLEVPAPQLDAQSDVLGFTVSKEGSDVERVFHGGLHTDDNIQRLEKV